MKLGSEDKKKLGILAVVGVGAIAAVGYMASQFFTSTPTVPPPVVANVPAGPVAATPARTATAGPIGVTAAALDPTLHMQGMLAAEAVLYRGSGRNIFSPVSEQPVSVRVPRPIASARPTGEQIASTAVVPSGPPPIDLRFFGTASRPGSTAAPRAFLLRGDEVYLASVGDVVQRRYKVVAITANSLTVQDLSDNHQQTLPLAQN